MTAINNAGGRVTANIPIVGVLLLTVLIVVNGCGDPKTPPPKYGVQQWKPTAVGGPIEIRPLPPAEAVVADYENWIKTDNTSKARVYETILRDKEKQLNYTVEYRRDNSPLGSAEHTYVRFFYKDQNGGLYEYLWHRLGHHDGAFMKMNGLPKVIWVSPNIAASKPSVPLLEIVAFEGVDFGAVLIAEP